MLPILHHSIPLKTFPFILNQTCKKATKVELGRNGHGHGPLTKRSRSSFHRLGAGVGEPEFEFDPVKAREALRKLDEQLDSLATNPANPPKVEPSHLNRARREIQAEGIEISGSFLTSVAAGLFIFTILYNIFFITVIKPSVDIPYEQAETAISQVEAQETAPPLQ